MHDMYDGLILYHGSYCEVREPELERCAARKDFGKGFYLTSSIEQAESFLRTAIGKAVTKGDAPADQDYGTIGSKSADDICISLLLPEKLKDQYCLRTKKAIDCLEFVESEKVWIRK